MEDLSQRLSQDGLLQQNNFGGRPIVDLGKQVYLYLLFSAPKEPLKKNERQSFFFVHLLI